MDNPFEVTQTEAVQKNKRKFQPLILGVQLRFGPKCEPLTKKYLIAQKITRSKSFDRKIFYWPELVKLLKNTIWVQAGPLFPESVGSKNQ